MIRYSNLTYGLGPACLYIYLPTYRVLLAEGKPHCERENDVGIARTLGLRAPDAGLYG